MHFSVWKRIFSVLAAHGPASAAPGLRGRALDETSPKAPRAGAADWGSSKLRGRALDEASPKAPRAGAADWGSSKKRRGADRPT